MNLAGIDAKFLLLGPPMLSEAYNVVKYTDISNNTEIDVIRKLSKSALLQNTIHGIILMIELGDLREGILPADLNLFVAKVLQLKGVKIIGIGTNLACFGGIQPDAVKMNLLTNIAVSLENAFKIKLEIISGGNSANYNWFTNTPNLGRINNLRIGESIFLGREPLQRKHILNLFTNAFTLVAEVIELKKKPSIPYGNLGQDAFGKTPIFASKGLQMRGILGIGKQDVPFEGLKPHLNINILGGSSNHLVFNPKLSGIRLGNEVKFNLNYAALVAAITSPFIIKQKLFIEERIRIL